MNIIWLSFNLIIGVLCVGFFFHTSSGEGLIFAKYSPVYALFLSLISLFWIACSWFGLRKQQQFRTILSSILIITVISGLLALLLLPSAYIYFHHRSLQQHVFTPINQNSHAFFQIEEAPDFPTTLNADTLKVLALGGSTTYGAGLERNEAYPAVLEEILMEKYPDQEIKVLNAGVPWHTSMHSLLRYVGHYSAWKPDVVIVLHAFNDIFQASEGQLTSGRFRDDYGHFFGALGNRINRKDYFAEKISHFLGSNWFARTWFSDLVPANAEQKKKPVNLLKSLPSFKRNMLAIVQRAMQDDAQVILATQAYLYGEEMSEKAKRQLFYDFYYKDYALVPSISEQMAAMDQFNAAVKEIAFHTDADLFDLESKLPKSLDVLYDDVHTTKKGAKLAAEQLAKHKIWDRKFQQ